jgi:hypothetical protein
MSRPHLIATQDGLTAEIAGPRGSCLASAMGSGETQEAV